MSTYLDNTEHASRTLISLIFDEANEMDTLKRELSSKLAEANMHEWDFRTSQLNDDFSEAHEINAFNRMAKARQDASSMEFQVRELEQAVSDKEESIKALAGALLQIAKQGISSVRGKLNHCPDGRMLGSEPLKNIIWQARNQSMHYEEGNPHPPVQSCFNNLAIEQDVKFDLTQNASVNLALDIVRLLGWDSYEAYEADMNLLL